MTVKLDAFIRLSTILCKPVRSELGALELKTQNIMISGIRYGPSYACQHVILTDGWKAEEIMCRKKNERCKALCKENYCHKEEYLCFVFMFDNLVNNMCC
ncbi:unnamed protein product [Brassica rapa subsp. trilocularis]